jgi:L-aspartate oxidase
MTGKGCVLPAADTVLARAITGPARVRPTPGPPFPGPRHPLSDSRAMEALVDTAVIGAGAAGLFTALVAAEQGARVALVSRSPLAQSASYWAQGGLAAAIGPDDDVALHVEDTLTAGRGTCRTEAVEILCAEAPDRVRDLEQRGIAFDRSPDGTLHLSLEGGHNRRRVVHAGGSATGRHVTARLSELVSDHPRIEVHERSSALALWVDDGRCAGVVTDAASIPARATVLGTGGAAALWSRTTNPSGAVGAGLYLALEAGAALADLELMQFHPTALRLDGDLDGFLVTEAVRGEGAVLVDAGGERFVDELAPRDAVARAIDALLRAGGEVFLDMRGIDTTRFPNIAERLAHADIDPRRDLIPVAPAAHYMIGGVVTDKHGRSTLPGLYAVGECACTGVHGANRLASNSLSECFVFGRRAALAALDEPSVAQRGSPPSDAAPPTLTPGTRDALWRYAGPLRDAAGLERLSGDPHPLARAIALSALQRRESRGCHLRSDFPAVDPALDFRHWALSRAGAGWEAWN